MKYFLDSAKLDEIKYAFHSFGIDGVTTNPRHIMASGQTFMGCIEGIADWVRREGIDGYERFPVSVEINPHLEEAEEMVREAKRVAGICGNFVIKIPCTTDGVSAARELESAGIRTNLTLVFSPSQAIIAAKNDSLFVSPFIAWKEDNGEECGEYIGKIVQIYRDYGFYGKTQIIGAAIRSAKQLVDCAVAGCDIVTTSLDNYKASFTHPYTTYGLGVFRGAWDNTPQ